MISTGAPLQYLLQEIDKKLHCVVFGGSGCGKTTLLKAATVELRRQGINVSYAGSAVTAKSLVRTATQDLLRFHGAELGIHRVQQKRILAGTKLSLCKFLIGQCGRRRTVLIIDPVAPLTKPYKRIVEVLMDHCTVVASTEAAGPYPGLFFWNFSKVKLENWTRSETFGAIDDLLPPALHPIPGRQGFKEQVFVRTGGNPKTVSDFCRLAQDRRYWIGTEVAVSLIAIDLGTEQIVMSESETSGQFNGSA